jgi:hypothetical protein
LPEVELGEVVPLLADALSPLALNALTLPLLLELPEFQARPQLVVPLLSRLQQSDGLGVATLVRAAELARQAGAIQDARWLVQKGAVPAFLRSHRRTGYLALELLERLAALDPAAALRVLRSTRPRGVRRDVQEQDEDRRRILAQANAALGRAAQARRLRPADSS